MMEITKRWQLSIVLLAKAIFWIGLANLSIDALLAKQNHDEPSSYLHGFIWVTEICH
jgi:hypothetical protein